MGAQELRTPYPGLRAFRRHEAQIFFGREEPVDELLERLATARFVAVAGESGCGKSSLVRAGLIPALEAGFMPGNAVRWRILEMRPEHRPFRNLAAAFLAAQTGSDPPSLEDVGLLAARLRRGPLGLVELLNDRPVPEGSELLLLVDQFEELIRFRDRAASDEAAAFVALLLETIAHPSVPIRVVLTLRTDYLGKSAAFRGLPEALSRSQYLTPLLGREQLREAIVGPARYFDGDVDSVLANHMVNEIGRTQDQLPVIQHALMWMWTRARARVSQAAPTATVQAALAAGAVIQGQPPSGGADGGPITLTMSDYEELGGLGAALSKHADDVYGRLAEPREQLIARKLFCALWDNDAKASDSRRPCRLDLAAKVAGSSEDEVKAVAGVFRALEHSFIMPLEGDASLESDTVLDVSHESLFRHWDLLKQWIHCEHKDAEEFENLSRLASEWRAKRGEVLPDLNLEVALEWRKRVNPNLDWAARYARDSADLALTQEFLGESERAHEARLSARKRRRIWRGVWIAFSTIALLGSVALLVVLVLKKRETDEMKLRAMLERLTAAASNAVSAEPLRSVQLGLEVASLEPGPALSRNGAAALRAALRQSHFRSLVIASKGVFWSAEFLPNDRLVTVGDGDGVAVWDIRTGNRLRAAFWSEPIPMQLAVDLTGRVIATAGNSGPVDLWDAESGKLLRTLEGHVDKIERLAFSPDGELLVSASADGSAKIWQVRSGLEKWSLVDHVGAVKGAAFTDDSQRLATTGSDGRIDLWEVSSGKKLRTFLRGDSSTSISQLAFNATGGVLAGSHGSLILLWDPITGHLLDTLAHTNLVRSFAFSPNGEHLASVGFDGSLKLWNFRGGKALWDLFEEPALRLPGKSKDALNSKSAADELAGGGWLSTVAFSADGQKLVTTGLDGTAKVWAVAGGEEVAAFAAHEASIKRVMFSADGKRLATGSADGTAAVWDRREGRLTFRTPRRASAEAVAFDTKGARLAVSDDARLTLWDVATHRGTDFPVEKSSIQDAKFFHRHERLVAAAAKGVVVWDVPSVKELFRLDAGAPVLTVAVSPDDSLLATECREGDDDDSRRICLWDGTSGKKLKTLRSGEPGATASATTARDSDPETKAEAHLLPVLDLVFSPDGQWLLSSSKDKLVKVWDIKHATSTATLKGHRESVSAIAVSADGKSVATAGEDWVRLWNAESWIPQDGFPDARPGANAVAFSPDGKQLAAGGMDGVVRLFARDPSALLPVAETRLAVPLTDDECQRYGGGLCARKPSPPELAMLGRLALRNGERDRGRDLLTQAAHGSPKSGFDRGLGRFEAAEAIDTAYHAIITPLKEALSELSKEKSTDPAQTKARFLSLVRDAVSRGIAAGMKSLEKAAKVDPELQLDPAAMADRIGASRVLEYARIFSTDVTGEFLSDILKLQPRAGADSEQVKRTSVSEHREARKSEQAGLTG